MMRSTLLPVGAALLLGACQASSDSNDNEGQHRTESTPPASLNLPAPLVPEAEAGVLGARNVLLGFVRALENGQLATAWALMGDTARGERSESEFIAEWSELKNIMVAVVDGEVEGAAGSVYYSSQATITAQDRQGRPVRYEGPIVLRRSNLAPDAGGPLLRWHIERMDLAQTH